ncbi:MAG: hypothetical protein H0X29_01960 [Parachlamydiaceae bacterium]|nr:hypothetical protein [Parachlamydiaceae bacterium]
MKLPSIDCASIKATLTTKIPNALSESGKLLGRTITPYVPFFMGTASAALLLHASGFFNMGCKMDFNPLCNNVTIIGLNNLVLNKGVPLTECKSFILNNSVTLWQCESFVLDDAKNCLTENAVPLVALLASFPLAFHATLFANKFLTSLANKSAPVTNTIAVKAPILVNAPVVELTTKTTTIKTETIAI